MTLKQVPDAQQFGGLRQVHAPLRARNTFEAELQIGAHRQVRKQARLLEHIAQSAFMRRYKHPFAAVLPDLAVDLYKTVFGAFQSGDAAQARGLAGARMPVQRAHATAGQLQVNIQCEGAILQVQAYIHHRDQLQPILVLRLE